MTLASGSIAAPQRWPSWRRDLLLLAAGLVLFLPGAGGRDLWNPDEPRYAEVAREMLDSGDWFVPHLNGEIYTQKPPLLFWLIALCGWLRGGVDEIAARLPSILAAAATLPAVFRLGARHLGDRAGWLAVAVFATGNKMLWQGRIGQIDMLLIALVAWSMWLWLRGFEEERRDLTLLGFALAGAGTVAKGPVSLLPALFGLLLWRLWERRSTGAAAAIGRLRLGAGLAVWAAVVLLWLAPAALAGGWSYVELIAFRQTVTRYADPWHHFQPWHYYLGTAPVDLFPWSLFLPAAAVAAWGEADERRRRGLRFAAAWVFATLVFFSVSPAKRTVYVLTMFPALSLLVASALDGRASRVSRRAWLVVPLAAASGLLAAAAIAAPRLAARQRELEALGPDLVPWVVGLLAGLAGASALGATLAARGAPAGAAAALATGMAAVAIVAASFVLPRFDAVKSPRQLAATFRAEAGPNARYAIWPRFDANVLFYLRRPATMISGEDELRSFLEAPGEAWIFARRDAWAKLAAPPPLLEVDRDDDATQGYLLLRRVP